MTRAGSELIVFRVSVVREIMFREIVFRIISY